MIAHWDEVEQDRTELGPLGLDAFDLGEAAGTRDLGVKRLRVRPGKQSSPVHVEVGEEEIFYVLGGSGLLWQGGAVHEVGPGDCIVHRIAEEPHTLIGGPDGLDVLAFGERADPGLTWLPRPRVASIGVSFVVPAGPTQFEREAEQGELELPEPTARPANVVNLADVEDEDGWRLLGKAGGSVRTGLNHVTVPAGQLHAPPHCHGAEEEIFLVLEGTGALELTPVPVNTDAGAVPESHPVRPGTIVSRPPRSGMAHAFRAGDDGLVLLAYGDRVPNDVIYYPRSNKIYFKGVGVIARLDHLAYEVGEESPY